MPRENHQLSIRTYSIHLRIVRAIDTALRCTCKQVFGMKCGMKQDAVHHFPQSGEVESEASAANSLAPR